MNTIFIFAILYIKIEYEYDFFYELMQKHKIKVNLIKKLNTYLVITEEKVKAKNSVILTGISIQISCKFGFKRLDNLYFLRLK